MTRPIIRTLLATITLSSLVATAAAQPGGVIDDETPPAPVVVVAPAPGQAPALSQINGTPIKVGEHNQYYYSFPKWNLSTNPFGIITGLYNFSASYAMSERVALRGDVNIFAGGEMINESGLELGIGAPIYFKKMYNGFFLEPGFIIRELHRDYDSHYDTETSRTVGPQILVGWHWTWDSGLNVALAFGMGRDMASEDDYDAEVFGNGYFRVGYAF